jgi:hypothetical protein
VEMIKVRHRPQRAGRADVVPGNFRPGMVNKPEKTKGATRPPLPVEYDRSD